jgi:hypothetical protein
MKIPLTMALALFYLFWSGTARPQKKYRSLRP